MVQFINTETPVIETFINLESFWNNIIYDSILNYDQSGARKSKLSMSIPWSWTTLRSFKHPVVAWKEKKNVEGVQNRDVNPHLDVQNKTTFLTAI